MSKYIPQVTLSPTVILGIAEKLMSLNFSLFLLTLGYTSF